MNVRIGGLIVHERRGALPEAPPAPSLGAVSVFPRFEPIDPDSVATLIALWSRIQEDEPRAVLAPWFVHTCHGRIATVDIADLHGNLVVRYQWSVDEAPIYSLFGMQDLVASAVELLDGIRDLGHDPIVNQISDHQAAVLRDVPGILLEREPDRDEYVVDAARHSALQGHAYKSLRYGINHFTEQHAGRIDVHMVDVSDAERLAFLASVLLEMPNSSSRTGNDTDAWEGACLDAFLRNPIGDPVRMFTVEIDSAVRAIGVFEAAIGHDAVVFHVFRSDSRYEGLLDFGVWALAEAASRQGFRELNLEEDLGIPGLRSKKHHLRPARMILHYTIRPDWRSEF